METNLISIQNVQVNYWNNKENRIELMKNLTKKLEINDLNDWYQNFIYSNWMIFQNI